MVRNVVVAIGCLTVVFSVCQTYVGDILVSVNPFKDLGIYGQDVSMLRYFKIASMT